MNIWSLPTTAQLGGGTYRLHTDYRDILDIFRWFSREDIPLWIRWQIAISLFYADPVPPTLWEEAATYLTAFIHCGQENPPGPKLFDWQQDADLILADVNRVAGTEIRSLPYLHWWTFLSYFNSIGDGQLAAIVSLRRRRMEHKKPEGWEKELYQAYRHRLPLAQRLTEQERKHREELEALLK